MQLLSKFAEGRKVPIPAEIAEYAGVDPVGRLK